MPENEEKKPEKPPEDSKDSKKDLNVRQALEQSTRKMSLSDLKKRGMKSVKVISGDQINDLIKQALNTVMERKGVDLEEQDKDYLAETRTELQKLMKQRSELQTTISRQQTELDKGTQRLDKTRTELHKFLKEKSTVETTLTQLKESVEKQKAEYDRLTAEQEELMKKVALERERQEREMMELRRLKAEAEAERATALAERVQIEEEIEIIRTQSIELKNTLEAERSKLDRIETEAVRVDSSTADAGRAEGGSPLKKLLDDLRRERMERSSGAGYTDLSDHVKSVVSNIAGRLKSELSRKSADRLHRSADVKPASGADKEPPEAPGASEERRKEPDKKPKPKKKKSSAKSKPKAKKKSIKRKKKK